MVGARSIRRRCAAALLTLAIGAVAACGGSSSENNAAPGPQRVPTLTVAIGGDERSLTPFSYTSGTTGIPLLGLVYDSLMVLDADNRPRPLLATGMEVNADGTSYRLPLHDGVTWHDGQPFSAADVVFSVDYYKQHPITLSSGLAKVGSVRADGTSVVFQLTGPAPDFVTDILASLPIVPAHLWRDVADPKTVTQAVGTGPYRLVETVPKQRYRFVANTGYQLGTPVAEELVVTIITEQNTAFAALQRGEVDAVAQTVPPQLVAQFRGDDELMLAEGPGFGSTLLQFNNERPPFTRPEVRRAIGLAIDVDELVRTVLLGTGTPAPATYLPPAAPLTARNEPHRYDPAEANRLLDELGYARGTGGVRVADGAAMEYTLLCYADSPDGIRTAELIADMLLEVGITANVQTLDMAAVDDMVWPEFDVSRGRDFDLAIWGWSAPTMLTTNRIGGLVASDFSRGFLNVGGFRSPAADQLVATLDQATDQAAVKVVVGQIQKLIAQDVPFVPLYYPDKVNVYRPAGFAGWRVQAGQGILNKLSFIQLAN